MLEDRLLPFVSIIMPVRDEAEYIGCSLHSVLLQDYPKDKMELIVADGLSNDGTRKVIEQLQKDFPYLKLVDNPRQIASTGLNIALQFSIGEIILRVDGHTTIAPDYIRRCVEALAYKEVDNVGGRMVARGQSIFGQAVALATSSPFGVGGARFHYSDQEEIVDTVYLGAWRKEVFDRIGVFDEELVRDQDDEFNYRLRKHGGRILLSPKINSVYSVRSTPWALLKQYFQYGYWKVRVLQKHPGQMRLRQFIPVLFITSLLTSILLALATNLSWIPFALILGAYLSANLVASIWTSRRRGWKVLSLLPISFAILHFNYGFGFLVGLFRFIHRWGDKEGKVPALEEVHA